jgi:hypothetical protein
MTWLPQAELSAADGHANDGFGGAVAISGDTMVVGAGGATIGSHTSQGGVYIYVRSGAVWTLQTKVTLAGGAASDLFGAAVAISGDLMIASALRPLAGGDTGTVYSFMRSGTVWTQGATFNAPAGSGYTRFGVSLAVSGNTIAVGAPQLTVGGQIQQGAVFVWIYQGATWQSQGMLTVSDGAIGDQLGDSVALAGDLLLAGAPYHSVGANNGVGSAYIFSRSGANWSQQARLVAGDGATHDFFGLSVAIAADLAVVGAPSNFGEADSAGAAYEFARSTTSWNQVAKLHAPDAARDDRLGGTVAITGSVVLTGAATDQIGSNQNQGSVWAFSWAASDLALVHNDSTGVFYPSLAAALLAAQSSQQMTATESAWRAVGSLDTLGRSIGFAGDGDIRLPSTSSFTLGGSSFLTAASGSNIDVFGQLRVSSNSSADVTATAFTLGSRGSLTARTGSSLSINAATADLQGQTRVEQNSSLNFSGAATSIGPTTITNAASMSLSGPFTNIDTFTITAGTVTAPLFLNKELADIFGSCAVYGSYTNDAGATTTIRSGSLYVFGSLTNYGTVVGTICSNCLSTPPNLDVGGDLVEGPEATLTMPYDGSLVHVGGNFDCAINSNTRYDLSVATLQLEGSGATQTLEVMSTDIGPVSAGLDRTLAGHYPIGTLEIGPAPSTVQIVDQYDNDNLGQASCEALYVRTLQIDAGSRLINPACRIYYSTLINHGQIDVPANLVHIVTCGSADYNCDGDVGTDADIEAFFLCLASTCPPPPCASNADFNGDGDVGTDADIEAFFRVLGGGQC